MQFEWCIVPLVQVLWLIVKKLKFMESKVLFHY